MIALLLLAILPVMLVISGFTACAVAVRALSAPSRRVVGDPPPDLGARTVSIPSGPGLALAGWFAAGQPGGGAVLLLHGIRSDRRALASRMVMLAGAGMTVLAIDLRAHGESGGPAITFGHREADDVAAALGWLRDAAPGERVGGLGLSLGGAALLLASRRVAVDALVLESVFPDIRAAVTNRIRVVSGAAHGVLTPLFMAVGTGLAGLRPADLRPIEALAAYSGPVLIVSGALDRLTTPSETQALFDAAPGPKQLWMVQDAAHVDMASAAGADYEGRVPAFLALHLRQNTACV